MDVKTETATTEAGSPATTAEQTATEGTAQSSQEAVAKPSEKPATPKWVTARFGEMTAARRAAEAAAQAANERVERIEKALRDKGITLDQPESTGKPAGKTVEQAAQELLAEREFVKRAGEIATKGRTEFPDFDDTLRVLNEVGEMKKETLDVILESDIGHKILKYLGDNPDEASELLAKPFKSQARAIGLLEARLEKAAEKPPINDTQEPDEDEEVERPLQVVAKSSKALLPEPIDVTPVKKSQTSTTLPTEKDSTADWMRKRQAQVAKQRSVR
jgi:hypothetical protein